MIPPNGDAILRQRFAAHLDMAKGGWMNVYDIMDGEKIVGSKTVTAISRNSVAVASYALDDQNFATASEFVAAYRARKAAA